MPFEHITKGEATAARFIVRYALAKGWLVSVNDGEEWVVKSSRSETEITEAMASTGQDQLLFRNAEKQRLGSVILIYGNAENGEELIADHSDTQELGELFDEFQKKYSS